MSEPNPSIGARRMAGSRSAATRFNLPPFPSIEGSCPRLFSIHRQELLAYDRAVEQWRAAVERSVGDAITQLQSNL